MTETSELFTLTELSFFLHPSLLVGDMDVEILSKLRSKLPNFLIRAEIVEGSEELTNSFKGKGYQSASYSQNGKPQSGTGSSDCSNYVLLLIYFFINSLNMMMLQYAFVSSPANRVAIKDTKP